MGRTPTTIKSFIIILCHISLAAHPSKSKQTGNSKSRSTIATIPHITNIDPFAAGQVREKKTLFLS